MSRVVVSLTSATMDALESEYGPLTVPPASLTDLVNALLARHVEMVRDARRKLEADAHPVGCD